MCKWMNEKKKKEIDGDWEKKKLRNPAETRCFASES